MGNAGGQEDPVAGAQLDRLVVHRHHRAAGEDHDPFVLLLFVHRRPVALAAEDLLDDEIPVCEQLQEELLARRRRRGGVAQPTSPDRHADAAATRGWMRSLHIAERSIFYSPGVSAGLLAAYDEQLRDRVPDRLPAGVTVERDGPLLRFLGFPQRGFVGYRDL